MRASKSSIFVRPLIALSLVAVGCAVGCSTARPMEGSRVYNAPTLPAQAPAESLAFDPPVTAFVRPMTLDASLDRSLRGQAAYIGYESSTTVGTINFDDRQYYNDAYRGGGFGGGFGRGGGSGGSSLGYLDRQAVSQTAIVRQR